VIDECSRVFSRAREQSAEGPSLASGVLQTARELGISLLAGGQQARLLSEPLLACLATKVALGSAHGGEIRAVAEVMGLNAEQADYLFRLEPGHGVVRLAGGAEPFLLKVPDLGLNKNVPDQIVADYMRSVWDEYEPSPDPGPSLPASVQPTEPPLAQTASGSHEPPPAPAPTDRARRLFMDVLNHPWSYVGHRAERPAVSVSDTDTARKELELQGYVKAHEVHTGTRGGRPVLLEPTDKAYEELELGRPSGQGKGGFVHQFWQQTISEYYERLGARAHVETMVAGKAVDVLVTESDGTRTAVEIQLSDKNTTDNIEKDLATGAINRVIVAFGEKKLIDATTKALKTMPTETQDRVEVRALGEFVSRPDGQ